MVVEAANVGGMLELLPKNMVNFDNPDPSDAIEKLEVAKKKRKKTYPNHSLLQNIINQIKKSTETINFNF